MNDKDKDLKDALDEIFGSDFIEIDVNTNNSSNKAMEEKNIVDDFNNENKSINYKDESIYENDEKIGLKVSNNENSSLNNNDNLIVNSDSINHIDKDSSNIKTSSNKNKDNKKRKIIIIVIMIIVVLLSIFIFVNYVFGITKVINCSSSAEDNGYRFTDEYKITYKKNKINYVESTYSYTALTDEFKSQIKYIKQDKLLVVVNSNGMPGFTYLYEVSDDFFKVNGYLDFEKIKFNEIDKIDQEQMPISYIKINSKTTFKSLRKNLEIQGYKCVPSK